MVSANVARDVRRADDGAECSAVTEADGPYDGGGEMGRIIYGDTDTFEWGQQGGGEGENRGDSLRSTLAL